MKNRQWLKHLEHVMPKAARGYKVSMYSIALEGWRRGLELKFFKTYIDNQVEIEYTLGYQGKVHRFSGSRGDKISQDTIQICKNKALTKEVLQQEDVPVPKGKSFEAEISIEQLVNESKSLGFPLVVKPAHSSLGKGVFANIQNEEDLKDALMALKREHPDSEIIVEEFVSGEDIRLYVIDNQVIGAYKRIPANIVGDGIHTIKTLIELKNKERNNNPNLYNRPIKIDNEVLRSINLAGYTLESIPNKGEQIFLRQKCNISAGGEAIDITDQLSPEIKSIAIRAAKATGIVQCGLDMMVDLEQNTGVVIEVNSRANIGSHLFPYEGEARDIPRAIIDYYFPETTSSNRNKVNEKIYFDFKGIMQILRSGIVDEVTVPPLPQEDLLIKGFTVYGHVQGVGYRRWVQKRAIGLRLNGFAKNLKNGNVLVVVAGHKENVEKFEAMIFNESPEKAKIEKIETREWSKPIKVGFEILGKSKDNQLDLLSAELRKVKRKNNNLRKRLKQAEDKHKAICNSLSWRLTKPLRKISSYFK